MSLISIDSTNYVESEGWTWKTNGISCWWYVDGTQSTEHFCLTKWDKRYHLTRYIDGISIFLAFMSCRFFCFYNDKSSGEACLLPVIRLKQA